MNYPLFQKDSQSVFSKKSNQNQNHKIGKEGHEHCTTFYYIVLLHTPSAERVRAWKNQNKVVLLWIAGGIFWFFFFCIRVYIWVGLTCQRLFSAFVNHLCFILLFVTSQVVASALSIFGFRYMGWIDPTTYSLLNIKWATWSLKVL